ncbi:MAG: long-chain fatty acid--CoA ligase [Spirochaetaceae bacterium]|nr:MAG: long-chain fatty acid--CoA ligase [Spirochaetaceae bacterium]
MRMSDHPWLPFYGETPASIEYPDRTMFELFMESASAHADSTAVEFARQRIKYGELARAVDTVATAMWSVGVRSEDRLGVLLPNVPHVPVLLYAANRIGAIVSFYDVDSGTEQLSGFLNDFTPNWVAALQDDLLGLQIFVARHQASTERPRGYISCRLEDYLSRRAAGAIGADRLRLADGSIDSKLYDLGGRSDTVSETAPVFSWTSLRRLAHADVPPHRELRRPDSPAVVLYTSGSSGPPRGVVHADSQLNAAALQTQVQGPLLARQRVVGAVPPSHGLGLAALIHAPLVCGARTALLPYWTGASLAALIRRVKPEFVVAGPDTYAALIRERAFRKSDHSNMMGAFSGGSRLARAVRDEFESIVRSRGGAVTIREGYGLSETVAACATEPDAASRAGSVGIPYPDTLIAIARTVAFDSGSDAPPAFVTAGIPGEIVVSGPTVMSRYWSDESPDRLRADDSGRVWLRTGDLGTMDADGFLYVLGRISDSGFDPERDRIGGYSEIELARRSDVADVVVVAIGRDSPRLIAIVVPMDPDSDPGWLGPRLIEALSAVDRRHRCDEIVLVERMPRTRTGSADIAAVRRLIASGRQEARGSATIDSSS